MVKIYIFKRIVTGQEKPFVLLWENDEQRKRFAQSILDMPEKEGPRGFVQYPDEMPEKEVDELIKEAVASL